MKRKRLKYAIFREAPNYDIVQVAGVYTNKREAIRCYRIRGLHKSGSWVLVSYPHSQTFHEAYDAGTLDYVL